MFGRSIPVSSLLFILLLVAPGCLGLGTLADVMAGELAGTRSVEGEISRIDTRRQEIELRSTWGGADRIRYDGRTQVHDARGRASVRDLQRGDRVRVLFSAQRDGERRAERIQIQQDARDRRNVPTPERSRVERIGGSIRKVDGRGSWFELQPDRGRIITVRTPPRSNRSITDRVRSLKKGQYVRVQGRPLGSSEWELVRFD